MEPLNIPQKTVGDLFKASEANEIVDKVNEIVTDKQDAEVGKGLSENNYSTADKTNVDKIPEIEDQIGVLDQQLESILSGVGEADLSQPVTPTLDRYNLNVVGLYPQFSPLRSITTADFDAGQPQAVRINGVWQSEPFIVPLGDLEDYATKEDVTFKQYTTLTIGRTSLSAGNNSTLNQTRIENATLTQNCTLKKLTANFANTGNLVIKRLTKNTGVDQFNLIDYQVFVISGTGTQIIFPEMEFAAGDYIAFFGPSSVGATVMATTQIQLGLSYVYAGDLIGNNVAATLTTARIEFIGEYEYVSSSKPLKQYAEETNITAVAANTAAQSAKDTINGADKFIGATAPSLQSATSVNVTRAMGQVFSAVQEVKTIEVWCNTAGAGTILHLKKNDNGTYDVLRKIYYTFKAGQNIIGTDVLGVIVVDVNHTFGFYGKVGQFSALLSQASGSNYTYSGEASGTGLTFTASTSVLQVKVTTGNLKDNIVNALIPDYLPQVLIDRQMFANALPAKWANVNSDWTFVNGAVSPATGGDTSILRYDDYSALGRRTVFHRITIANVLAIFDLPFTPQENSNGTLIRIDIPAGKIKLSYWTGTGDGTNTVETAIPFTVVAGRDYRFTVQVYDATLKVTMQDCLFTENVVTATNTTLYLDSGAGGIGRAQGKPGIRFISGSGSAGDIVVKQTRYVANYVANPEVVVLGDSNLLSFVLLEKYAQGVWYQIDKLRNKHDIVIAGRGGEDTPQLLQRLNDFKIFSSIGKVVLVIGTNDTSRATFRTNMQTIINDINTKAAEPIIGTIPPQTVNQTLATQMNTDILGNYWGNYRIIDYAGALSTSHARTAQATGIFMDSKHFNEFGDILLLEQVKTDFPEVLNKAI